MKNQMAASILRNIVSSFAGVKAREVKLMGEISPEFNCQNRTMNGSLGSDEDHFQVWGWNAESGFVEIADCVGVYDDSNYAHYERTDIDGKPLHECEGVDKYIFFIVHNRGYSSWSGQNSKNWNKWELYKAPNFQEKYNQLEKADIVRWENFLR